MYTHTHTHVHIYYLPVGACSHHSLDVRNVLQIDERWRLAAQEPGSRLLAQREVHLLERRLEGLLGGSEEARARLECEAAPNRVEYINK